MCHVFFLQNMLSVNSIIFLRYTSFLCESYIYLRNHIICKILDIYFPLLGLLLSVPLRSIMHTRSVPIERRRHQTRRGKDESRELVPSVVNNCLMIISFSFHNINLLSWSTSLYRIWSQWKGKDNVDNAKMWLSVGLVTRNEPWCSENNDVRSGHVWWLHRLYPRILETHSKYNVYK